jgi:MSHA biogenesis protein MshK
MVEHLKPRASASVVESRQRALNGTTLFLVALTLVPCAFAQSLNDPTRPPTVSAATDAGATVDSALVLQSILVSPGRRLAVINGQTVKQGDKLGETRVVDIREGEVVLRSDQEITVLKLFPGIEKERVAKESVASRNVTKSDKRRQ